uniref:receptor protein-tyrosine kinase n=1 Tax=Plectus sambesii TaxID=2011161 RepID=A0A914WRL4_9BILA
MRALCLQICLLQLVARSLAFPGGALKDAPGNRWRSLSCYYGNSTSCDCSGSNDGKTKILSSNPIQRLRNQYENCTREKVDPDEALKFLESIEEVTGYVFIYSNDVSRISLPKLRIVWGDTVYYDTIKQSANLTFADPHDGVSFFVFNNLNLQYIDMPELRSIERGKIVAAQNNYLCYWQQLGDPSASTIDFGQLVGKSNVASRLHDFHNPNLKNFEMCNRVTDHCHPSCTSGHCWGPGANMCQIIYRNNCPTTCKSGMCSKPGEDPQLCCHKACAAGCYGPRHDQCYACKSLEQDGACVEKCNGLRSYNHATGMTEPHTNPRYTYKRSCVKQCPENTLTQGEHCVTRCNEGFYADAEINDRICRECQGACPKRCTLNDELTSEHIDELINCTIIEGRLVLLQHVMTNFSNFDDIVPRKIRAMTMDDLEKLSHVRVITDYLEIQMGVESPQTLNFLRNLKIIEGRRLSTARYAMLISSNDNLYELGLTSLKHVRKGHVYVGKNSDLCYANSINWDAIIEQRPTLNGEGVYKIHDNKSPKLCERQHAVCDIKCNRTMGCWGAGDRQCFACVNWRIGDQCVDSCPESGYYKVSDTKESYRNNCPTTCESGMCSKPGNKPGLCCHKACAAGCFGPQRHQCYACQWYEQDGACVRECNGLQTYNPATGVMEPHQNPRYTDKRFCVKQCPKNTLIQGKHCVTRCYEGYYADLESNDRVCHECHGPCPKRCELNEDLTSEHIDRLINCTIIEGHIALRQHVMTDFFKFDDPANPRRKIRALTIDDLEKLSNVRVITDYLEIQMGVESPQTLNFLRNLKIIEGRRLSEARYAMLISSNYNLHELGLTSLKHVHKGHVYVGKNSDLCYADSINWDAIIEQTPEAIGESVYKIMDNENPHLCSRQNAVCDTKCNSTMGCWGDGDRQCFACANWRIGDQCVDSCPEASYYKVYDTEECRPCHAECDKCTGEGPRNCISCKHASLQFVNSSIFECLAECPESHYEKGSQCLPCYPNCFWRQLRNLLIGASVAAFILLVLAVAAFVLCNKRRKGAKYMVPLMGYLDPEHRNAEPNMARLDLISADQLSRSAKRLGSGAFGVVYGGYWMPEGTGKKVPVAIKLLQETSGKAQQEMLAEAGIMAGMRHPHLLLLVGVCLSEGLQLITPLRPLGSLLEFVQKHKQKLGSLELMSYCRQIASAMEYLEQNRLVHRDLACRNVLVKTTLHVEVTDFGLAKMLDYGESEVYVEGRVAVKWLALESLLERRFTHASDMWAFGVTMWEILTFGQSPYAGVQPTHIKDYLINGNRLSQPENCAQELYQIMLQCWMESEEARPTFTELANTFSKMLRMPHVFVLDRRQRRRRVKSLNQRDQRGLINELLQDTDASTVDSLLYYDNVENNESRTIPRTQAAPTSFVSSTIPRMSRDDNRRQRGTFSWQSTNPLARVGPRPLASHGTPSSSMQRFRLATDDGNYLMSNSGVPSQDDSVNYTPVVHDDDENEIRSVEYYNENNAPNGTLLLKGVDNQEYMANETRSPVSESETTV